MMQSQDLDRRLIHKNSLAVKKSIVSISGKSYLTAGNISKKKKKKKKSANEKLAVT